MKICIIVDGYNAGRQFPKAISERGFQSLHVQSTEDPIKSLSKFDEKDYIKNIIYYNNVQELIDEILSFVNIEDILCVIAGSEPGVILTDLLSERLGLSTTNGTELSEARRNKFFMREAVRKAGLATPLYFQSSNLQEIKKWVQENPSFPIVVKPLDSAGTDGVFICHNEMDAEHAFLQIMNSNNIFENKNNTVLVESFLYGTEYVVNSVSYNGHHKVNDIWVYKKQDIEGRKVYDREELLDFNGQVQKTLVEYAHKVLDALGIKFGPSHAEIMFTATGPVLVEVGARISGATNIASSQECVGHDVINMTIDSYIDPEAFMRHYQTENKLLKYGMVIDVASRQEGLIIGENFTEKLSHLPSLKSMVIKKKIGDSLTVTKDLMSSPVKIHLTHEDKNQIQEDYNIIQEVSNYGFILQPLSQSYNEKNKSNNKANGMFRKHDYKSLGGLITPTRNDSSSNNSSNHSTPSSNFSLSSILSSFFGDNTPQVRVEQNTDEKSEVKLLLERLSKGWSKRSGVKKYDSSEADLPEFDLDKDDFLAELLPFGTHPTYLSASEELKKLVLTYAWIMYNQKTIAIEADIVSPACMCIIRGEVDGLNDRHSKQLAAESMTDESFHTLLVTQAIGITEEKRGVHVEMPNFSLVKNLCESQDSYSEPWKKMLVLLATAIVSEIFISDYLKLISESETVQPINRQVVAAHRIDELTHSKIFKAFAKALYPSLNQEQQAFFAEILPKPIYWFADKELNLWEELLANISFPGYEVMISDCKKEQYYHLEYIDYTGIINLAEELGIENFSATLGEKKCTKPSL